MDHIRISGTELSLVILSSLKIENWYPKSAKNQPKPK